MLTNEEVEAYIMSNLPSTYGDLCRNRQYDCRKIDGGLQRLRRRKVILYHRKGRSVIWEPVNVGKPVDPSPRVAVKD